MSALVVLIAASLILASGFLFAFIRATKKGQYEDVYTPSVRILFEDFEDRQKATDESHEVRGEILKRSRYVSGQSDSLNDETLKHPEINSGRDVQSEVPKIDQSQTTKKWN